MLSYFLAIFAGAALSLSFSFFTWQFSLLAFLSYSLLFSVMAGKRNFIVGFVGGISFFLPSLYWIVPTLKKYGGISYFLGSIALFALAAYLALYFGLFSWSLKFLKGKRIYFSPFLWVGLEILREALFTGFPWGSLGYTVSADLPFLQWASLGGVYFLSFLMVGFALLLQRKRLLLALFLLLLFHLGGFLMIGPYVRGTIKVAVLQNRWDFSPPITPAKAREVLSQYENLGNKAVEEGVDLLVFPETTIPFIHLSETYWQDYVKGLSSRWGTWLVFSATWVEKGRFYNSVFSISPDGRMWRYDKIHLVPFGEYNPLPFLRRIIPRIAMEIGDFSRGRGISLLRFQGEKFASPVCYEAIFPELVREMVEKGAEFLVNVTNDAWYGKTSAPWQHFYQARLRAVENRRYLIRGASSGISAVVDPYGRILQRSQIYRTEFIKGSISPRKNLSFYTITGKYQRIFYPAFSLFLFAFLLVRGIFRRNPI